MKTLMRHFKKVNGQSLAEFAVTTAMMATLATTAAPKFSGVGEGAKEKKTLADIDKILKSANNFYNTQVTKAGRGRFPGQWKYNEAVPTGGGYTYTTDQTEAEYNVKLAVQGIIGDDGSITTQPTFTGFDNTADAPKWASCFGTNNPDALVPEVAQNDPADISTVEDPTSTYYSNNEITEGRGAEEFLDGFGGEAIKSPFQDGHYIYTVIAGAGSGTQSIAPIIFVADLESPSSFWKKLQP
jgi:Tfp pilus assembly protein FimT